MGGQLTTTIFNDVTVVHDINYYLRYNNNNNNN